MGAAKIFSFGLPQSKQINKKVKLTSSMLSGVVSSVSDYSARVTAVLSISISKLFIEPLASKLSSVIQI
jgi:hypothetical protein